MIDSVAVNRSNLLVPFNGYLALLVEKSLLVRLSQLYGTHSTAVHTCTGRILLLKVEDI